MTILVLKEYESSFSCLEFDCFATSVVNVFQIIFGMGHSTQKGVNVCVNTVNHHFLTD